ncbi:carotenoid oxygenase family protein [Amycolatopsis sp. WQ 127309]|uniref:carotenoid oxygenase family protein n=1 Tax=Amycolatopsis sp. WQ 127309 TaxID=2932773 RepID=UPI001FF1A5BF|nr:carotenoid oxygenase family protein [Amycolatopsis sp. WQ 127309]UOZ07015.1 carotenoid oxygenase family protein [Amycolatopsis sp. WQ 127309]
MVLLDCGVEDDGWVLTYVTDLAAGTSRCAIHHGSGLLGDPVATVHLPDRVPPGFRRSRLPD